MEKLDWIFENLGAEAIPPVECCHCTSHGVDIGELYCMYLTNNLVVVTPGGASCN